MDHQVIQVPYKITFIHKCCSAGKEVNELYKFLHYNNLHYELEVINKHSAKFKPLCEFYKINAIANSYVIYKNKTYDVKNIKDLINEISENK